MSVRPLVAALVAALLLVPASAAWSRAPVDAYASYQPATACSPSAKPGTVLLGRWIVARYGGRFGTISRACGGSRSEHQEGRAFDWAVDVRRAADRTRVHRLMAALLATDSAGNTDALARRMGVMYVIWNDHIYAAWDGFKARAYRASSCPSVQRCSRTLRHQDHLHISITRGAAAGRTTWYAGRL